MAADKATAVSGANVDGADALRRRNVAAAPGAVAPRAEADDRKKAQKQGQSFLQILDAWEPVIASLLFTGVALFTRLWKIGQSNIVT